jgi:serine/threonine protein phosphatase PrpC
MRAEMSPDLQRQITPEAKKEEKINPSIGGEAKEIKEGQKVSEDDSFLTPDLAMGVFDGMGSGPAGEKASRKAKEMFLETHKKMRPEAGVAEWRTAIENTLREANQKIIKLGNSEIFKMAKFLEENPGALVLLDRPKTKDVYKAMQESKWDISSKDQQEFAKLSQADIEKIKQEIAKNFGIKIETPAATTATVAKAIERPDGDYDVVYGHVGDSRLYVLRTDGGLEQVTQDQGALQYFLNNGDVTKEEAEAIDQCTNLDDLDKLIGGPKYANLKKEEKEKKVAFFKKLFENRHGVTSGLGFPDAKFQTGVIRLKPGERLVVVSDGNSDVQTNEQLAKNAASGTPAEAAARINAESTRINRESDEEERAKKPRTLRAKHDDKTAIVVEIPEKIKEISAEDILAEEDIEVVPIEN